MTTAYSMSQQKTFSLLENPIARIGDVDMMHLAYLTRLRRIIASKECLEQSVTH